jgi:hypothetical protein
MLEVVVSPSACQQVTNRNMDIVPPASRQDCNKCLGSVYGRPFVGCSRRSCYTNKTHLLGIVRYCVTQRGPTVGSVWHFARTSARFNLKLTLTKLRFVSRFLLSGGEVQ